MPRRAKTPIAGTLAAIPLSALLCGAATSQVISDQVQLGDVFTEQTMNVVDVSEFIGMTSTAMGNGLSASNATGGPMTVNARQTLQGAVQSTGVLEAAGTMGQSTVLSSSATGNSIDTGMDRGTMTALATQHAGPAGVLARTQTEAAAGGTVDFNDNTQAINNSFGMGLTNAAAGVRLIQTTEGSAFADGGAIMGQSTGAATVASQAVGNNATMTGVQGSAFRAVADQTNAANLVQASKFTAYGSSYVSTTAASASANNLHATNEGGLLDVTSRQANTAYVRAQAEETSAYFSAGTANAYGVGNSMIAGSMGPEVVIVNEQLNELGGVESTAYFGAGTGYDATASATAMGNAATGYACSDCGATLRATNNQTNSADVGSTARMTVGGPSRTATGTATSVGNNASYYISPAARTTQ
jgi:hypothetical protein